MLFQRVHYVIFSILVVFLLIPAILYPMNFNSDVSEGKIILKSLDLKIIDKLSQTQLVNMKFIFFSSRCKI